MRRFASIASGLFMCVTGCGDDDGARTLPDAPVYDAAAPDSQIAGSVNVTAFARCCDTAPNTPQEGVLVVAVLPDRTVASTAMTDAQGQATLAGILPGTVVTAVYPEDTDNQQVDITSYVGVQPGDALTFGESYYTPPTTGVSGELTINWPAVPNATYYYLHSPCSQYYFTSGTTATFSLQPYCQTPTAPVVLGAYDGDGLIASAFLPAAPYTPGTLDITPAQLTSNAANNFTVSMSGLETSIHELEFGVDAAYPNDIRLSAWSYPTPKAGAATAMLSVATTAPATIASAHLWRGGNYGQQSHYKSGASPIAFTGGTMPWINGVIVSPGAERVIWLQTAGTYDAATLRLNWRTDTGQDNRYYDWNIIVPPGVTELDLGPPPAELAPHLPTVDSNVSYDLTLVDLASAADYDAARALPEWRVMDAEMAVRRGDETGVGLATYDGGEGFPFAP